jgi:putative Mg2+ transporter-C (MgtC) family protein
VPFDPPTLEVGTRLLAAATCSALVGLDREAQRKPAGLRTHILLGVGAALFLLLVAPTSGAPPDGAHVSRVLQGLVGGLGFLSAGQILRRGLPTGLTTAADLWVVGGIGAACGLGRYAEAALATIAVVFVLRGLGLLERVAEHRRGGERRQGGIEHDGRGRARV